MLYYNKKFAGMKGNGLRTDMSDKNKVEQEDKSRTAGRRKTAAGLKKCNFFMLMLSAVILLVLCVALLVRVYSLNGTVDILTVQANEMRLVIEQQREQLEQIEILQQKIEDLQEEKDTDQGAGGQEGHDEGQVEADPEPEAAHKVYLTFDDGPGIYTQEILEILDEYNVKATFFVVGKDNDAAKEAMKKIVEKGHTLAMHSYSHDYSEIYASVENFAEDFAKIRNYIYDVTGVTSTVYRFPGGSSNSVSQMDMDVFARYLDGQGVKFFDWNISSGDGGSYVFPVETLLENCTSKISSYERAVILMHDSAGKRTTIEALPSIIETILDMEDTVILPITDSTDVVQHIKGWEEQDTDTGEE